MAGHVRLLCLIVAQALQSIATSIHVSMLVPEDASNPVDKQFLGLGIEARSFPTYTGTKKDPNQFSLNLLSALTNKLGHLPIRVGGTTLDFGSYNPHQQEAWAWQNARDDKFMTLTTPIAYGNDWFEGFSMVPGAKWILDVPLVQENSSNAVEFAKAGYDAMPQGTFQSFEIGNEPNLYAPFNHVRPPSFDQASYNTQWIEWTNSIVGNMSLPTEPLFWVSSLANGVNSAKWSAKLAMDSTPSLDPYAHRIQAYSQHYYQTGIHGNLQEDLLNHTKTVDKLRSKFENAVDDLRNSTIPIPFILGEVGNAMTNQRPIHTLQSSLGSAIWLVDFLLAAMCMNVQRVNLQNIDVAGFSSWWPAAVNHTKLKAVGGPTVWATWYGQILVADLINQTTGQMRILPLQVSDDSTGHIVAYAAYNDDSLTKMIILNEQLWTVSDETSRPVTDVTLTGLAGNSTLQVEHLSGPSGDETQNITWSGQQWSYQSNGLPVTLINDSTTVNVDNGTVSLSIPATEAIVLTIANQTNNAAPPDDSRGIRGARPSVLHSTLLLALVILWTHC